MAKKSKAGDEEHPGPTDLPPAAEEMGPTGPAGAGGRAAGETAPTDRPAPTPQSLERLRRKLKAKYH